MKKTTVIQRTIRISAKISIIKRRQKNTAVVMEEKKLPIMRECNRGIVAEGEEDDVTKTRKKIIEITKRRSWERTTIDASTKNIIVIWMLERLEVNRKCRKRNTVVDLYDNAMTVIQTTTVDHTGKKRLHANDNDNARRRRERHDSD